MINETDFSPMIFKDKNKEKVQREAYKKWEDKNYKGTLEIATGVGKTFIGLMAVLKNLDKKTLIVVPKVDLQKQWIIALKENLKLTNDDIGKVGNGFNEYNKKITVAVVNSIRNKMLSSELLIMDEMHRYGSKENFKFLKNGLFNKILGLTATAIREDGREIILYKYAPLIYEYGQKLAIKNNLLSKFILNNVAVNLTVEEKMEYNKVNLRISELFPNFNNNFYNVQAGAKHYNPMALELMACFQKRRTVVMCASLKINKSVELVNPESKTLIFCEFISIAEKIVTALYEKGIPAVQYHSKLKKKEKNQMLDDFKNNKYKVMVAVKSLDEGTNIPDCDTGIITGATSVPKQMVQRFGRVLRKSEGKEYAKLYHFYVPGTKDFDWMKKRITALSENAEQVLWS